MKLTRPSSNYVKRSLSKGRQTVQTSLRDLVSNRITVNTTTPFKQEPSYIMTVSSGSRNPVFPKSSIK